MEIYYQGRFQKQSLLTNIIFCLLSNIFLKQIALLDEKDINSIKKLKIRLEDF